MKTIFLTTAVLSLASTLAFAQQSPTPVPTTPQPDQQIVPGTQRPLNTLPESQARERLMNSGYTNLSTLTSDPSGLWRGTATKDGRSVNITVDGAGRVVQQ